MVRTRAMAAVPRNPNLIRTKEAQPKRKAVQPKRKAAQLKRKAAISSEELKRMAAESAVDVEKILRLKKEAMEAMDTECFPLTAKAKLAAAAAAAATQPSGAEKEEIPKKKKVVKYLVSQAYLDHLKAVGLFNCVDEIPQDKLAKESQLFRDAYHANVLLTQKLQACQKVLLDQYETYGYAYDAKEVTDDEGEGMLVVKN